MNRIGYTSSSLKNLKILTNKYKFKLAWNFFGFQTFRSYWWRSSSCKRQFPPWRCHGNRQERSWVPKTRAPLSSTGTLRSQLPGACWPWHQSRWLAGWTDRRKYRSRKQSGQIRRWTSRTCIFVRFWSFCVNID